MDCVIISHIDSYLTDDIIWYRGVSYEWNNAIADYYQIKYNIHLHDLFIETADYENTKSFYDARLMRNVVRGGYLSIVLLWLKLNFSESFKEFVFDELEIACREKILDEYAIGEIRDCISSNEVRLLYDALAYIPEARDNKLYIKLDAYKLKRLCKDAIVSRKANHIKYYLRQLIKSCGDSEIAYCHYVALKLLKREYFPLKVWRNLIESLHNSDGNVDDPEFIDIFECAIQCVKYIKTFEYIVRNFNHLLPRESVLKQCQYLIQYMYAEHYRILEEVYQINAENWLEIVNLYAKNYDSVKYFIAIQYYRYCGRILDIPQKYRLFSALGYRYKRGNLTWAIKYACLVQDPVLFAAVKKIRLQNSD